MVGHHLSTLLMFLAADFHYSSAISAAFRSPFDGQAYRREIEIAGNFSTNITTHNTVPDSTEMVAKNQSAVVTEIALSNKNLPNKVLPKKKLLSMLSMEERIARDDWRAPIDHPVIIWSKESRWHPDFSKDADGVGGDHDKVSVTSRYMSFAILGSVIAFVFYAYLSHMMYSRKVQRREARVLKLSRLMVRAGYESSSLGLPQIVVNDDSTNPEMDPLASGERRKSILNLFKGFRL